ncbi:CII-binding regulator of phage lambda lysogenization HflD [Evansella vedderi]|uniref:CII-binding regulator of phage lambda lysogenization HflD n=1 Tax=Evansella vedderi TaxID=38282 RepID=A0ABT9ZTD7_9BACI|nr:hypothetical protein [Evansella vedderi]MDQ0254507.1 CII-binding regulator of phage lambda lysogenization HflD [Evansella vedderi]
MSINKEEELSNWQNELTKQKEDILRRKTIIENKLEKYNLRLDILKSAKIDKNSDLFNQVQNQVDQFEKELNEFNEQNAQKLMEMETIIQRIEIQMTK